MSDQEVTERMQADLTYLALKEARRDGIFAGLTSGLASAVFGSRLMGLNRNKTILCGVLTGILSGYFFMQAFESSNMSRIKKRQPISPVELDEWMGEK